MVVPRAPVAWRHPLRSGLRGALARRGRRGGGSTRPGGGGPADRHRESTLPSPTPTDARPPSRGFCSPWTLLRRFVAGLPPPVQHGWPHPAHAGRTESRRPVGVSRRTSIYRMEARSGFRAEAPLALAPCLTWRQVEGKSPREGQVSSWVDIVNVGRREIRSADGRLVLRWATGRARRRRAAVRQSTEMVPARALRRREVGRPRAHPRTAAVPRWVLYGSSAARAWSTRDQKWDS